MPLAEASRRYDLIPVVYSTVNNARDTDVHQKRNRDKSLLVRTTLEGIIIFESRASFVNSGD